MKILFFLICYFLLTTNVNASWFDDIKNKLVIGYQNYDDCIIGELKGVDPRNHEVKKAIKNKCNKDFPLAKPVFKTLEFSMSGHNSVVSTDLWELKFSFYNDTQYSGLATYYISVGWGNEYTAKNNHKEYRFKRKLILGNNTEYIYLDKPKNKGVSFTPSVKIMININQRNN